MADVDDESKMVRNLTICVIAAACAGVIISIYHCLTTNNIRDMLNLRRTGNTNNHLQTLSISGPDNRTAPSRIEPSIAQLIPSYKYQKGTDDNKCVLENDDGMCPVCLSDFEDGEQVRKLPGCKHCFHASCIDMWLFSHSNCPMCRTITSPSPRRFLHLINPNSQTLVAADMQTHHISQIDRRV